MLEERIPDRVGLDLVDLVDLISTRSQEGTVDVHRKEKRLRAGGRVIYFCYEVDE